MSTKVVAGLEPIREWKTIEDLFDLYLGGARPCDQAMQDLRKVETQRAEVKEFVARMFFLMGMGRFNGKDISPFLAWAIGAFLEQVLPGAFGGSVPPYTLPERHKQIDRRLERTTLIDARNALTMLDMGCGFPPVTAADTAKKFPHWQVIGADPGFGAEGDDRVDRDMYRVFDSASNYAFIDQNATVTYFQAGSMDMQQVLTLYQNQGATIKLFGDLYSAMLPKLPPDDGKFVQFSDNNGKLERWPDRENPAPNLTLETKEIGDPFQNMDVIRCFDVLNYFDTEFRHKADLWALASLRDGGIFICGGDGAQTSEARYTIYRKENGHLIAKEFAFSLDNMRPNTTNSWWSMHDNEREVWELAKHLGTLRADANFRSAFDQRMDQLQKEWRMLVRDENGCLVSAPDPLDLNSWATAGEHIASVLDHEGWVERAAEVLRKSGLNAWRNPVGHIAVQPDAATNI
jgi:hypothetical protein